MKLVKSNHPYFHTFHRAWGKCVGLPLYDKRKWNDLEGDANAADAAGATEAQKASLLARIEVLLVR